MRVFGLTGGIASGKSTVARRIVELGIPVIDADQLAREVVEPKSPALQEIAAHFGPSVLAQGELDRARLAALVFHDPAALRALGAIVHPRVAALFRERCEQLAKAGHALACYEVPLLFENGLERGLRPVVLVAAPESVQIERAVARGLARGQAEARLRSQASLADKRARADFVIENDGALTDALAQTDAVLEQVKHWLHDNPDAP